MNRPGRPLVLGKLKPQQAWRISWIEFSLGILLSLFINFTAFLIALFVSGFMFVYSYRLKRLPLIGNLAVSLATAMAFIYGGVAVNRIKAAFIPAVLAFFFHFGREIIKDLEDMVGDERVSARTFPLVYGEVASLGLTTAIFLILFIILPLPFIFGWYDIFYLVVIVIGVYPVLFYVTFSMWKNRSPQNLGYLSNLLKADMLVGLLAIYFG